MRERLGLAATSDLTWFGLWVCRGSRHGISGVLWCLTRVLVCRGFCEIRPSVGLHHIPFVSARGVLSVRFDLKPLSPVRFCLGFRLVPISVLIMVLLRVPFRILLRVRLRIPLRVPLGFRLM